MASESDSPQPIASEAEIDALEYVVEEGRIASREDYGILRSWLCRLRPAWESTPAEPSTPGEGTRQGEGTPQPVAWLAFAADGSESAVAVMHRDEADEIAARHGWHVAPLYRSPDCPYVTGTVTRYCTLTPFTLTDAERFVLREVRDAYADEDDVKCNEIAAVIDRLLERTRCS